MALEIVGTIVLGVEATQRETICFEGGGYFETHHGRDARILWVGIPFLGKPTE